MPLIIMTGFPSSGKTKRATEIREYFENVRGKKVIVVSENHVLGQVSVAKVFCIVLTMLHGGCFMVVLPRIACSVVGSTVRDPTVPRECVIHTGDYYS